MSTATEQSTPNIPGSEGMEMSHETSLHRLSTYPIVKDGLSTAYSIVHSSPLLTSVYDRTESLSKTILERLVLPIAQKLPIETVDGYANGLLDVVEKRFPLLKEQTSVVVEKVRAPADGAYNYGKQKVEGVQSLANSATEDLHAKITQSQELLGSLLSYIPRDQAQFHETYGAARTQLDSLRSTITTTVSELPTQAQTAYQPVLDGLTEAIAHFQTELARKDITYSEKATSLTTYSKEKVLPLLAPLKDLIIKKKAETEQVVEEVVEDGKKKVSETKKKGKKEVEEKTGAKI